MNIFVDSHTTLTIFICYGEGRLERKGGGRERKREVNSDSYRGRGEERHTEAPLAPLGRVASLSFVESKRRREPV